MNHCSFYVVGLEKKICTHVHTLGIYIFIPHNSSHASLCCCLLCLSSPFSPNYSSQVSVSVKTMPFALQTNGGVSIGLSSFAHCVAICDRDFPAEDSDSSSDSSIGRNSISSEDSSDQEDAGEVESSFKGPLDTMNDLEEDLPVK